MEKYHQHPNEPLIPNSEIRRPRCPSCDMFVDQQQAQHCMPFCSDRCRMIDLGRWLNEEVAVPCQSQQEDSKAPPTGRPALPPGWHDA
ncbi:MAG: DNA gyrase inhibitor YacG [Pirellulaceae bacterium]|nr:DNA gyrase inhibitor YacG [Pirellulaceae bacterium]